MGSYGWRRRAASVALAALTVCGLAGCGSGESGPPTLNWYINPDSGGQAEIANRCTQAAGGRVPDRGRPCCRESRPRSASS